ncbi:unnamed protein product, partial [Effrenium voratum]
LRGQRLSGSRRSRPSCHGLQGGGAGARPSRAASPWRNLDIQRINIRRRQCVLGRLLPAGGQGAEGAIGAHGAGAQEARVPERRRVRRRMDGRPALRLWRA